MTPSKMNGQKWMYSDLVIRTRGAIHEKAHECSWHLCTIRSLNRSMFRPPASPIYLSTTYPHTDASICNSLYLHSRSNPRAEKRTKESNIQAPHGLKSKAEGPKGPQQKTNAIKAHSPRPGSKLKLKSIIHDFVSLEIAIVEAEVLLDRTWSVSDLKTPIDVQ